MPETVVHNQQHTCRCGSVWLVIKDDNGRLIWLRIGEVR